jgi:cob(I)alamin adenosyltransferase
VASQDQPTRFRDPNLLLNRIYTRHGDGGQTRLAGGRAIAKDATRLETYGTVDELNAYVGMAVVTCESLVGDHPRLAALGGILLRIQHELFNAGSILATSPKDVGPSQPRITAGEVEQLEREIDAMNEDLPALPSFVLPGGSRLNAELHVCRTVCRRAERLVVALGREEEAPAEVLRYLNRLSDALFVWSRWANAVMDAPEVLWQPNRAASAQSASPAARGDDSGSPGKPSERAR